MVHVQIVLYSTYILVLNNSYDGIYMVLKSIVLLQQCMCRNMVIPLNDYYIHIPWYLHSFPRHCEEYHSLCPKKHDITLVASYHSTEKLHIHIQMIECTWYCQKYRSITMEHVHKYGNTMVLNDSLYYMVFT